jgi:DNA-directed RNA polymerase I, II, and III subunit RPABC2
MDSDSETSYVSESDADKSPSRNNKTPFTAKKISELPATRPPPPAESTKVVIGDDAEIEDEDEDEDDEDDDEEEDNVADDDEPYDDDSAADDDDDNDAQDNNSLADPDNQINNEQTASSLFNDLSDDEDDDDNDNENYLQKFDESLHKQVISEYHPELHSHSYDEINAMSTLVRDQRGNIIDPLHQTLPFITRYEKARILGERAKQINAGAKPFVEVDVSVIDGYLIALSEFEQKKIPFIVKRPMPNGGCEYWKLSDLEILV